MFIRGGTIGREFLVRSGSNVELIGGEFRLHGADFTESTISLTFGDVFTGTLTDGSVFLFSPLSGDTLRGVTLTSAPLPTLDTTRIIMDAASSAAPPGLRSGQSLTLRDGGVLGDNFAAVDATLDIEGGTVGESFEVADSVVNINGGSVGAKFAANSGSAVNISGGSFGDSFYAISGSEIHLFGTEFVLDGVRLDALPIEQAVGITDRNVTLLGLLADGSEFSFFLFTRHGTRNDYFPFDATLTVTRVAAVPEPTSLALVAAGGLALAGLRRRRASGW